MRRIIFILLLLHVVPLTIAPIVLAPLFVDIPEPPSWPQDLVVKNEAGEPIKFTPICVRPEGTYGRVRLYADRSTNRILAFSGGYDVAARAERSLVYDREDSEIAALIVEDLNGNTKQISVENPGQPLVVVVPALETLEPMSSEYASVFAASQKPLEPRISPYWGIVPFVTFVLLLISYRTRPQNRMTNVATSI